MRPSAARLARFAVPAGRDFTDLVRADQAIRARRCPGLRAVSSGCCKEEVAEGFGGGGVAEDAAGPGVEPGGDVVEVVLAVAGQVGALGEVVAEQAVCVLVGA